MITIRVGNLLESDAQTLTNTVNCVGIMGKGIALQFKEQFPDMFRDYVQRCKRSEVELGTPYLYRQLVGKWILNFPTKDHWRGVANLNDIVRGLEFLVAHYKELGIESIAIPPLGCGNGQLEWNIVGPTLYRELAKLDIPVELYAPAGTPQEELTFAFLSGGSHERASMPKDSANFVPPAFVALTAILDYINRQPYKWPVGRVMFQKFAYFGTEYGLPTELTFTKGSYGPYSDELKRMVARMIANGLVTEHYEGSMISVRPGPTYHDARQAYKSELDKWSDQIRQLINLLSRMRTDDAELAASVHFAYKSLIHEQRKDIEELEVYDYVMEWKKRRRPALNKVKLADTIRGLNIMGVVNLRPNTGLAVSNDGFMYEE